MSDESRRSISWLELVVIAGCASMMFALLFPAVSSKPSPSRRSCCANHLRHWSVAVLSYEAARQRLPGSQELLVMDGNQETRREVPVTWLGAVSEYLERADIRSKLRAVILGEPATSKVWIEIAVCPSAPFDLNEGTVSSYVANAGYAPRRTDPAPLSSPQYLVRAVRPANGLFLDRIPQRRPDGTDFEPPHCVRLNDIRDGASCTIMLSENLQAGPWTQIGPIDYLSRTFDYYSANDTEVMQTLVPRLARFFTTFVWLYAKEPSLERKEDPHEANGLVLPAPPITPVMKINGGGRHVVWCAGPPSVESARPSSLHPGGVYVVFADGSAMFLSENIDYHVYQQLMTPDGIRSDAPFRSLVISESDYHR